VLYPLKFHPIFKERIWGGRKLQSLYNKSLPPDIPVGESWEISDRPDDTSVIANGPLAGKDLRWLMENHQRDLLGDASPQHGRFPLLVKILDATDKLSLQVHPPAHKAGKLGGEPKTEMWYVAHAAAGAELYVGLKQGVTREEFERRIQTGGVAECFHRVAVKTGDVMFLPSGRVHAIGAGLVIFEIQQNSDTTYRVFDWDRTGADGKPRELHVAQSLASIDFRDFEPALVDSPFFASGLFRIRSLVRNPLFRTDVFRALSRDSIKCRQGRLRIVGVLERKVVVIDGTVSLEVRAGQFCLIPAGVKAAEIQAEPEARFLITEPGE
jgi:mannose-6-phosphate isomerase